jgi:dephospho-CoA kinase
MLASMKIPVHEADDEVHRLLGPGGKAAEAIAAAFPYFEYPQIYGEKLKSGARSIRRGALGQVVFYDDQKRLRLEKILHPLVREAQGEFIRKHRNIGSPVVVLDIPLLFETGGENLVNYTLVVTAPYEVQRRRVMERPNMDEAKFNAILSRQMPDGEKCARADFVIHTGLGRAYTMRELKQALAAIKKKEKKNVEESPRPLSRKARKSRDVQDDLR